MGYPYPNFCLCAFWGSFCGGQGKKEPEKLEAAVSGTEGAVDEIESRSHSMQSQRQRQRERERRHLRGDARAARAFLTVLNKKIHAYYIHTQTQTHVHVYIGTYRYLHTLAISHT